MNKKKRVYIHQFMSASSRNLLPLAAGLIYSYSRSIPKINDNFDLNIEILRDPPEKIVKRYKDPLVLAYSCYFWNINQSIEVAKLAKKRFPEALIIFGGPIVPLAEAETREFFKKYPFVNIVVAGEGEIVFSNILLGLVDGKNLKGIEGICYHDSKTKQVYYQEKRPYIKDLSHLPSPYLDGTFDKLYNKHKEVFTGAIFETNRGCPYSCAFCFWGGPDSRIATFPLDRVYAEIDWMNRHKINYISGADANFGILNRDQEIAKYITDLNKKTGYPKYLSINWAKNTNKEILKIADILSESEVKFMLTSSVQSLNSDTLKAVRRNNIRSEEFDELVKISNQRHYHIHYSEYILGLPLETYQSFIKGIERALVDSLDYYFSIYYCFLIPSTEMSRKEYRDRYKIETRRCFVNFERTIDIEGAVPEYEDIVVSTSTMPVKDWRKAFTFGYLVKVLHCYRIAYLPFNYLRKRYRVNLIELTEFIIKECSHNSSYKIISKALGILERLQDSILNNDRETIKIEGVKTSLHPEVAVFITLLFEKRNFYQELYLCLNQYMKEKKIEIDRKVWKEIFALQFAIIPTWKDLNQHYLQFDYNISDFLISKKEIVDLPNRIVVGEKSNFKDPDDFMSKQIYGGLRFYIAKLREADKRDPSDRFIAAEDFFENHITGGVQVHGYPIRVL